MNVKLVGNRVYVIYGRVLITNLYIEIKRPSLPGMLVERKSYHVLQQTRDGSVQKRMHVRWLVDDLSLAVQSGLPANSGNCCSCPSEISFAEQPANNERSNENDTFSGNKHMPSVYRTRNYSEIKMKEAADKRMPCERINTHEFMQNNMEHPFAR